MKIILTTGFVFILFSLNLSAQMNSMQSDSMPDFIRADRPYQTPTVAVTPKGYFQMEHGFSVEDTEPGFVYQYPASLWKYGLNNKTEVRLVTQYRRIQKSPNPDVSGFLPLALGLKTTLTQGHGVLPSISFLGHVTIPGLGHEDYDVHFLAPDVRLAFHHNVSAMYSIGYSLGAEWNGNDAEPRFHYSLLNSVALGNKWGLYIEGHGSALQRHRDPFEVRVNAGLTYLVNNNLRLDASAGQGLTTGATGKYIALGFSYRFSLMK